jgi:uncharacterized protein YegP (UPF0339 family)
MAEFEIYEDQNNPGEFRWRLRANNKRDHRGLRRELP